MKKFLRFLGFVVLQLLYLPLALVILICTLASNLTADEEAAMEEVHRVSFELAKNWIKTGRFLE